jgi:hypothetical protein
MKIRKSISYAYPTSATAELLGHGKTGCYYVASSIMREDGNWSLATPLHNAEGFPLADEPDLIASYKETEGEACPYFWQRCSEKAKAALGEAPKLSQLRAEDGDLYVGEQMLLVRYEADEWGEGGGDCDRCPWPMRGKKKEQNLRSALYDARECGFVKGDRVLLPNGKEFHIE